MSQQYMTVEQAANHLGVSVRTVRTYVGQELLSTRKQQGSARKWLHPTDVEELRRDRLESPRTSSSIRKELLAHRAQLRRMRAELNAVLQILDTQNRPLHIKADYARDLYRACLAQLSMTSWTFEELAPWVPIFFRLDENDLLAMRDAVEDPKPWVPLLKLCMRMTMFVVKHSSYATDIDLQTMHRELAEGRRRLRISAMCFMDLHSYDLDEAIRRSSLADSPQSVGDVLSLVLRKQA